MKAKVKLTPKDCLYLDDALTQLCAIKTKLSEEKNQVKTKSIITLMDESEKVFTAQFNNLKKLLKEASQS